MIVPRIVFAAGDPPAGHVGNAMHCRQHVQLVGCFARQDRQRRLIREQLLQRRERRFAIDGLPRPQVHEADGGAGEQPQQHEEHDAEPAARKRQGNLDPRHRREERT
ncbi:MAG: hypothetical protein FJW31_05805 [Acidobacteria bacterium]|nr:hypothetical protein [Acidobacteriota bacterium]